MTADGVDAAVAGCWASSRLVTLAAARMAATTAVPNRWYLCTAHMEESSDESALFVSKGLNRIQRRCLTSRVIPKEHAHRCREANSNRHRDRRCRRAPPREVSEQGRAHESHQQPDDAPSHTHDDALYAKLRQHVRDS